MPYYHLEPVLYYTHVLKAYTDVDHHVEVRLLKDNKPLDFSQAVGVTVNAYDSSLDSEAIDMSKAKDGILRLSFKGFAPGAYWCPITLTLDGETIVFGRVRVFVEDTGRSDDVTDFYYYPDSEEEEEGEEENPDEETEPGPEDEEPDDEEPDDEEPDDEEPDDETEHGPEEENPGDWGAEG